MTSSLVRSVTLAAMLGASAAGCGDGATVAAVDSGGDRDAATATDGGGSIDAGPGASDAATDARAPAPDAGADRPALGTSIAAVGCSNTRQAYTGYTAASSVDAMVDTAQGGNAMAEWSAPSGGPWDRYDRMRPAEGYSAVWLNLCARARDGLDQSVVDTVIANIRARDADVPIVISPLNLYEGDGCAVTNGNEISTTGVALADATAAADPMVFRGPDLGPLSVALLQADQCHLNDAGIALVGDQMVAYFDAP